MMRTDDLEEFSKMMLNADEIKNELGELVKTMTTQAKHNEGLELNSDGQLN